MKKGFTLAEQVVVLMALGVIFAIMIPIAKVIFPDKDKALLKKAYFLTQRTVDEMINNDTMYPDHELGFSDTSQVFDGGAFGNGKFRENFKSYFTGANDNITCFQGSIQGEPPRLNFLESSNCFTTSDNITWGVPNDDFSDGFIIITLYFNQSEDEVGDQNIVNKNAFLIKIDKNGRISIPSDNETGCPDNTLKRCKTKELLRSGNIKKDL